jgi:hypothetical protein
LPAALALDDLAILAPEEDTEHAEDLARRSGARWKPMRAASDAPAALIDLIS